MPPGWDAIRDLQLALYPECHDCGQPATEVHHVVPRYQGGTDDLSNLQSLCTEHHRKRPTWERLA
jgi:5-methylcytosine-specific restriction endonuclease McrA